MVGRPSKFSQEIADRICEELEQGKSLIKICEAKDMPAARTVRYWLNSEKHAETFLPQYTRAREGQADFYADEIVRIADTEEDPQKAKIRIDARKWVASKLKSKAYGDRVVNEHSGPGGSAINVKVQFVDSNEPSADTDSL